MYKCKACNGTDVEELMWVNMNTGEAMSDSATDEFYCNTCGQHTDVIYEKSKEEDDD